MISGHQGEGVTRLDRLGRIVSLRERNVREVFTGLEADVVFARDADNDPQDYLKELNKSIQAVEAVQGDIVAAGLKTSDSPKRFAGMSARSCHARQEGASFKNAGSAAGRERARPRFQPSFTFLTLPYITYIRKYTPA